MKDTTRNAQDSGHFGWSMATFALRDAVNASAESVGPEVDEFLHAGVEKQEARVIPVSLVKASPIKFECKYYTTLRLPGDTAVGSVDVVIGRVVAVHVEDWALRDGQVDLGAIMPIARCGYLQYTVIKADSLFEMSIPGDPRMNDGLAGDEALVREWDPKGRRSDHAK
ncbi:uncharacterized protein K489DRAFT_375292 [Dissoconium aciculare CBS 342.82]|uniref:Flavin reductase like domain-containing protein n=1 Tax=Dissoconium aciculare CBS 342.82 TaxID=1314786 RepID=A0A6J3MJT7_9PEZI|nr:uncharacterized protein K489DRAFT_375292 [Dissoconium aciculare CBS 342.82]KAF1827207.1 hypothetical protein K489DRAFT_375292 [Dissoconium aciculare CBS 342.82]